MATIDALTISDAGFDRYLMRGVPTSGVEITSRTLSADNLVGGTIGGEGVLYVGSTLVKIDGPNKRIVINDGAYDRILIGYQSGGF